MWIEVFPAGLAIGAVCVAVYTDLKNRIIPDKMTYPLIVIGIAFNLFLGIYKGSLLRALYGMMGGSLAFGIGYGMYLTGGWAGGDVKFFTGLGALLPVYTPPFNLPYATTFAPYSVVYPLFPLTLLFNSIIAAAPVILIYILISGLRNGGGLYETVKISSLEEGMIPSEIIYENGEEVSRYDTGYFGFLSRAFGTPNFNRRITNPDRAAGVTQKQVEELQTLVREGKLEDKIKIKKGMPFAPAFGAGVFIGLFYGSIYWKMLSLLI